MLSEADMQAMPDVTPHRNKAGDVIRHELLGPDEWMVIEATLAGAGKSYCHTYPDAWKLSLRRLHADGSIDWISPRMIRFQDTNAFPDNMVLPYLEPLRQDRLSLGEAQRLNLARAFLTDRPMVLLDEPSEHLDDDQGRRIVVRLLNHLADRIVVTSTHRAMITSGAISPCPIIDLSR